FRGDGGERKLLGRLVDQGPHAGRRRGALGFVRRIVLALIHASSRRLSRRDGDPRHHGVNAETADARGGFLAHEPRHYRAGLNFTPFDGAKFRRAWKGFVDRNGQRAPASRANSHALSASGRIISALAGANSLVAVPSRTRPMMPCKMAAMRKKL